VVVNPVAGAVAVEHGANVLVAVAHHTEGSLRAVGELLVGKDDDPVVAHGGSLAPERLKGSSRGRIVDSSRRR